MSAPEDWQQQAMDAIAQMKVDDVTRTVFGVSLPREWMADLRPHVLNGNVRKLLGVKAITFEGKTITRLEAPKPKDGKEG